MPCTFKRLEIPEVILVELAVFGDSRGFFMETYRRSQFAASGISDIFVQDNYSHSSKYVLRGLHYQKDPAAQGKLVQVIRGEIFDVAVDIRRGSPTYGTWVASVLSEDNHHLLYIPPGFAHGFCTLSDVADVTYKATSEYSAGSDRGIIWNDPHLQIAWPVETPLLSSKDSQLPPLAQADNDFTFEGSIGSYSQNMPGPDLH